jgi:hypothetical protein
MVSRIDSPVAVGGVLREYIRELELGHNLISEDEEANEVDEGSLYFEWKRELKKYKREE